ncbi:MAG: peptide-methionine (R)-S-oxide reductase MsrB [Devosia sp.]
MNRRDMLFGGAGLVALGLAAYTLRGGLLPGVAHAAVEKGPFPFTRTDEEWRAQLSDLEFDVLRQEGTERPFTSPLNDEKRAGIFHCRGCDQALFDSATKYDSRTGWPSFYQPLPGAIGEAEDRAFGMVRTEVHCSNCGGHQGHVFPDGPPPTGLRYCINGVSMTFKPATA